MSGTRLVVDRSAIAANSRHFAALMPGRLMAVVKADGYGAGAELVARTALANGATRLGVTSIAEALALRAAGLSAPILSWLNTVDADFAGAIAAEVEIAVPGVAHLDAVRRAARRSGRRAVIHLQIDCGMAREGCAPALWPQLLGFAAAAQAERDVEVVGVMGHLSCASTPSAAANRRERARFLKAVRATASARLHAPLRHLAATAATLTQPAARHTLCRVGAGLVGIDPSGTVPLRGALMLQSQIVDVRRVPAGTPVGYDHSAVTTQDTTLALVAAGYADGVPRAVAPDAEILVRGRRRRIVGRVSMDQLVVDLGADGDALPGEFVTIFGPGDYGEPTVADWAAWCGTIPNEIVTGIGRRVERVERAEGLAHAETVKAAS